MATTTISVHLAEHERIEAYANYPVVGLGEHVEVYLGFSDAQVAANADRLTEAVQVIRERALRRLAEREQPDAIDDAKRAIDQQFDDAELDVSAHLLGAADGGHNER